MVALIVETILKKFGLSEDVAKQLSQVVGDQSRETLIECTKTVINVGSGQGMIVPKMAKSQFFCSE